MLKWMLASCMLFTGFASQADVWTNQPVLGTQEIQENIMDNVTPQGLPWVVGDRADYNLQMGGFINGSMTMEVREETKEGFWVDQNVDLGFMGKQKIEMLVDKDNGQVLRLIVNGKEQDPPERGQTEVIEMKEDRVTVPKGTFDCVYIKSKNKENGNISEAWVNPREVPVMGLLKSIQPSQFGEVNIELTDYARN